MCKVKGEIRKEKPVKNLPVDGYSKIYSVHRHIIFNMQIPAMNTHHFHDHLHLFNKNFHPASSGH